MKVPLYEDAAALTGLVIAAAGLFLTQITGNPIYDGAASVGIGVVLVFVAWRLGTDSRRPLLGEAASPEDRRRVRAIVASFPEVTGLLRLLTMHLGPREILVTAEVPIVDSLDTDRIERLIENITAEIRAEIPEVTETFIELHPEPRRPAPEDRSGAGRGGREEP